MTSGASAPSTSLSGAERRRRERELLADLADLEADDPRRAAVRDELVTMHLPLVQHLARRYRDRGESVDDLVQVGTVGLIKAVDRFDVTRDVEFSTYATPTILGEIKRHFRDRTWAVRVPRRMQELQAQVTARSDELTRTLHRAPTVRELAASLERDRGRRPRRDRGTARLRTDPIDDGDEDGTSSVTSRLGVDDPAFEAIDDRETLRPLLERLPERERRIILLRFFHNMSQTQIAEELGMSQMHVSRLLARSLAQLRAGMTAD